MMIKVIHELTERSFHRQTAQLSDVSMFVVSFGKGTAFLGIHPESVQFSHSVMSNSLQPHELQHPRPPCPSPTPGVYSNSCPLSRWWHATISFLCPPLLLLPSIFPSIRVFSNESALRMRWPKYWSFSFNISPFNEHPGLIFRMDWLDLLAVQGTLKSLLQYHSSKASILQCSAFFYSPTLTSIHGQWENHSLD